MLVKRTFKNQITIPKKIMKCFENIEYFDISVQGNKIILRPVEIREKDTLTNIREKIKALGLKEEDILRAIRWARRQS